MIIRIRPEKIDGAMKQMGKNTNPEYIYIYIYDRCLEIECYFDNNITALLHIYIYIYTYIFFFLIDLF